MFLTGRFLIKCLLKYLCHYTQLCPHEPGIQAQYSQHTQILQRLPQQTENHI